MGNSQPRESVPLETTVLSSGFIPGDLVYLKESREAQERPVQSVDLSDQQQRQQQQTVESISDQEVFRHVGNDQGEGDLEYYVVQSIQMTMVDLQEAQPCEHPQDHAETSAQQTDRSLPVKRINVLVCKSVQQHLLQSGDDTGKENACLTFPCETLCAVEDERFLCRRVGYRLLQIYTSECEKLTTEHSFAMNQRIMALLHESMRRGELPREIDLSLDQLCEIDSPRQGQQQQRECRRRRRSAILDSQLEPLCAVLNDVDCTVVGISLRNNSLGEDATRYISRMMTSQSSILSDIDLSGNPLTVDGASTLAQVLSTSRTIVSLSLAGTCIGTEGCTMVIDALIRNPHHSIMKLDLRYNGCAESQIASLLALAQQQEQFCFLDIYPHHHKYDSEGDNVKLNGDGDVSHGTHEHANEGWLTLQGWVEYGKLRDALSQNVVFVQKNPSSCVCTSRENTLLYDVNDVLDFVSFHVEKRKKGARDKIDNGEDEDKLCDKEILQTMSFLSWKKQLHDSPGMRRMDNLHVRFPDDEFVTSSPIGNDDWVMIRSDQNPVKSKENDEPMIMCKICMEEKPATLTYILDQCYHKFCLSCIETYLSVKIKSFEVDSIRCPDCSKPISHNETEMLLKLQGNTDLIAQFQNFSLKKALLSMPGMIWCPNPQCSNAMLADVEEEDDPVTETTVDNPKKVERCRRQSMNVDTHCNEQELPTPDDVRSEQSGRPPPSHHLEPNTRTSSIYPALPDTFPNPSHGTHYTSNAHKSIPSYSPNWSGQFMQHQHQQAHWQPHFQYYQPQNYHQSQQQCYEPQQQQCYQPQQQQYYQPHLHISFQEQVPNPYPASSSSSYSNIFAPRQQVQDQGMSQQHVAHLQSQSSYQPRQQQQQRMCTHLYRNQPSVRVAQQGGTTQRIKTMQQLEPNQSNPRDEEREESIETVVHLAPVIMCQECRWTICTKCKLKAHAGLTCGDARTEREHVSDAQFKDWMENHKAKQCPYCGMSIDKQSGCNDMHCKSCDGHFCWVCMTKLGKQDDGNLESLQRSVREHFSKGSCFKYNLASFLSL